MSEWILIIAMVSPGGDYIDKTTIELQSKKECEMVRVQLSYLDNPMWIGHKSLCVTKNHWTGKKKMPGVAYD